MPARRTTRAASSTPARTLPSAARTPTQGNTPGRTTALESTPLPNIEAEQSFAYGSSMTKLLPQQLVARKKMTIEQMAETLDAGILQAERNFLAQRAEAEQYGMSAADARAARARRRSSDRESREDSLESDQTPVPEHSRRQTSLSKDKAEQWLQDIPEETNSQEEADDQEETSSPNEGVAQQQVHSQVISDRITLSPQPPTHVEGSSMPEVTHFDQTYSQERRLDAQTTNQPPADAWDRSLWYLTKVRHICLVLWDRLRRYFYAYTFDKFVFQCYKVLSIICILCLFTAFARVLARNVCDWYCETSWSVNPSRPWHYRMNELCRYSSAPRWSSGNTTETDTSYNSASTFQTTRLMKKIKQQEKVLQEMHAQQSVTSVTIDELAQRQSELLKHQSDLQSELANAKASQATASSRSSKSAWYSSSLSPIFKRINYASPGLGAIIDPYLTSPTKTKHFPFYQRLLLGSAGVKKYQSRPPIEALKPWSEVGDCWCAASARNINDPAGQTMDGKGGRYTQLGIMLGHDLFPDEVVIEHLPLKTTPSSNSAPKDIEVWGDFSHLNQIEFAALQMGPHALKEVEWYPQLGLLGRLKYDAVANEDGKYVQIFRLEFNQGNKDEFWMQKVVFRINSNWGGENTCLYRVRVHGVPVHAHPQILREEDE